MCGILGVIENSGRSGLTDQQLCAMRDTMAARGPDDATMLRRENLLLGHRRLAIRDIAGGSQPWVSADGRFALVYNGELYNDDLLRDQLQNAGHQFRTTCDTEVLMAAWLHWKHDCVEHLRGMFAFGVYDFQNSELFLARDRLGVKPLFYTDIGGDFAFASAIPALATHPRFTRAPNLPVLRHYLTTFRITLDRDTVFSGIKTLLPGETLVLRDGSTQIRRYWQAPLEPDDACGSFEDAAAQFEQKLIESVSIRLRSDVPVGMMLSGGVDSSTLACLLHRERGLSMTSRCGGGILDRVDDAAAESSDQTDFGFARRCAQHVGFDFAEVAVDSNQYHDTWLNLIDGYGTPLSTPTDAIIHRVAVDFGQSIGVALGGEGADEACLGYLVPHWSGNDFDLASLGSSSARESLQRTYGCDKFASAGTHYLAANGLISSETQAALFQDAAWESAFADGVVEKSYDRHFDQLGPMPNVQKTAHLLLRVNLESLLSRLDSATMAASLESRVPYTDHELVEQAFRLPMEYRIRIDPSETQRDLTAGELNARGSLQGKRILRNVATRLMPESLAMRPKASFPTPVPNWLDQAWKPWLQELYASSPVAGELFRPSALAELTALPPHLSMWNWPIANVVLWANRWLT